jgi:hypothetical protein
MQLIANSPPFFFLLAGIAVLGLLYMWLSLKFEATILFFSIVRRAKKPLLYWALTSFNALALALVYFGVLYAALVQ